MFFLFFSAFSVFFFFLKLFLFFFIYFILDFGNLNALMLLFEFNELYVALIPPLVFPCVRGLLCERGLVSWRIKNEKARRSCGWSYAGLACTGGRLVADNDLWIAASAVRHSIPRISNNRAHFDGIPGLVLISEAPVIKEIDSQLKIPGTGK